MPGLYANVNVGNTIGLYQQNTGTSQVLTSAQSLLSLLSNAGTVGFSLTSANTQVQASVDASGVTSGTYGSSSDIPVITVGSDGRVTSVSVATNTGGTYGNANVAAYLAGTVTIGNLTVVSGVYWSNGQPYSSGGGTSTIYGNANVASFLGNFGSNSISTTGNVTAGNVLSNNYLYANGVSILTGVTGNYSNTNVAAYLTTATINTTGNITGANLTTAGNLTAAYVKGDGSLLTNLPVQQGTYSNTNVAAYLTTATISTTGNITAANLTTAGNVTAAYVKGNGSLLTNLPVQQGTYSNTNVTAYLTTATISTTGNITGANLTTAGNVTAAYVKGNGSLLTALTGAAAGTYGSDTIVPTIVVDASGRITQITTNAISGGGSYGNTNVAAYLGSNAALAITTTANITTYGNVVSANYLYPNGVSILTGIGGTYSNTNVAAYLTTATISTTGNITGANLTTTGNLTASYVKGDGSLLTNLPTQAGTYSNANVASYMPVFGGNILAGNVDIPYIAGTRNRGPLAIGGNLNHYDSGVVASFQGNEATYLYTSLQNTNTGNTAYASYAVNDGTHTYYGELGINSGTYDYAAAGYPNNAFSKPYATFIQSTGANLAIGTYDNNAISFLVNGQTNTADAMTIANTGNVTVTGNLAVGTLATVGNIKSTNGYFWANGTAYSTGGGSSGVTSITAGTGITANASTGAVSITNSGVTAIVAGSGITANASTGVISISSTGGGGSFSGDLAGNILYDSVNERILMRANNLSAVNYAAGSFLNVNFFAPNALSFYGNGVISPATGSGVTTYSASANVTMGTRNGTNWAAMGQYNLTQMYPDPSATTMNNADRSRGVVNTLEIYPSGKNWGTVYTTATATNAAISANATPVAAMNGLLSTVGTGYVNHNMAIQATNQINPVNGSANVFLVDGVYSSIGWNTATAVAAGRLASNIGYARLFSGVINGGTAQANLTISNAVGLHLTNGWAAGAVSGVDTITNRYAVLNEDAKSIIQTNGNIVSTNNISMNSYQETVYAINGGSGTSGNIAINYTNGTIQQLFLTGGWTLYANSISNMYPGSSLTIIESSGGSARTLTTAGLLWAGGAKTLSSYTDVVNIFYDGTNYYASIVTGYQA